MCMCVQNTTVSDPLSLQTLIINTEDGKSKPDTTHYFQKSSSPACASHIQDTQLHKQDSKYPLYDK